MKDEIKEAINNLNGVVKGIYRMDEAGLEIKDIKAVLDYITNLQEKLDFIIDRNDEKQERIDKAIEYITSEETINMFSSINAREKWLKINHKILNILQGSDNNE